MNTFESTEQAYSEDAKRLRAEIEERTGRTTEELYEEREKRIRDAIELQKPDRVPVVLMEGYSAARYCGVPLATAYYDAIAWKDASRKMIIELEPDSCMMVTVGTNGHALEALDSKQIKWPGGTLPPDVSYQFVEGEYMKEDEYDLFLADPTDFIMRYYMPRAYGALQPLAKLPPLRNFSGFTLTMLTPLFATPEFRQLAADLARAGQKQIEWQQAIGTFQEEMALLGFPSLFHGGVGISAPFDTISDFFRGMRGAMLDMYRQPAKLLAACEKILEWRIAGATPADPAQRGNPKRVFMPLNRGAEGFMSRKQFETFYWPGLKKAILTTIDLGYTAVPFFEGQYGDRLEYLLELPKGKVVCIFEHTDMAKAKEILGGHLCIMGNVPSSLLVAGSVQDVEEYCRNLIEICGKGGGFILVNGSSIDEARPENIKAMIDSVKKYGVYS
jgi:uroporphyrinogen-III decarboxylase